MKYQCRHLLHILQSLVHLILEFHNPEIPDSGWVHVSYNRGANRMQRPRALKEDGKTVYKPGLVE